MGPALDFQQELSNARQRTDDLFGLIRPDSLYERPIPERHRLIFYPGHLEAFDWNLVCRYALSVPAFHPEFDRLFAFGIDPDAGGLPQDRASDWPGVAEIGRYNAQVRQTMDGLLRDVPAQLLHVAIEHRLMHAETFAYLLHNLEYARKQPVTTPAATGARGPAPAIIEIPAGSARLGRPSGDGFGWDNEFREYSVEVPSFRIGKYKVTNADYLEFVRAGGQAPHFWTERDGRRMFHGMFGEVPLPLDCPVYATYEQASAYAAWRGGSLPTEAQWHRAAEGASPRGNLDFRFWDPVPVDATPEGDSAWGVAQTIGNGWEWTSTPFAPFPGFEPFPFYRGYSADFFDGKHFVLKGASPRTAARLARHSFRNWFRPEYPYVYATFHVVNT
jgi:formylglycine-generating enzyme required for sulfatase activity